MTLTFVVAIVSMVSFHGLIHEDSRTEFRTLAGNCTLPSFKSETFRFRKGFWAAKALTTHHEFAIYQL